MSTLSRHARRAAAAALALGVVVPAAACGSASAETHSKITLMVATFGNFGYKTLLREYEGTHPGIDVVEKVTEYNAHHDALVASLDAGAGAADVVGIDEGFMVQFRNRGKDFVNLLDHGAGDLAGQWLPWKWDQTLTDGGRYQIGLGTDVGGLGMCYRPDLFKAAGLPTDREKVAQLWPTWKDYIAVGGRFADADLPAQWTDSATNIFNQILAQQKIGYFDQTESLVLGSGSGVRIAWDLATEMVEAGESAKYVPFSHQWTAALQGGRFATLTCPAWVLGWIQQNAPATKGMWDVARVPGGAGNWGGSWLAVPKQSTHPAEAYELASWLTAPEQQLRIFRETGNLPSQPKLYTDPAVLNYTNPFFLNAPVGKIFTSAVQLKSPQYLGDHNAAVRRAFEDALASFETSSLTSDKAWAVAVEQAGKLAAG